MRGRRQDGPARAWRPARACLGSRPRARSEPDRVRQWPDRMARGRRWPRRTPRNRPAETNRPVNDGSATLPPPCRCLPRCHAVSEIRIPPAWWLPCCGDDGARRPLRPVQPGPVPGRRGHHPGPRPDPGPGAALRALVPGGGAPRGPGPGGSNPGPLHASRRHAARAGRRARRRGPARHLCPGGVLAFQRRAPAVGHLPVHPPGQPRVRGRGAGPLGGGRRGPGATSWRDRRAARYAGRRLDRQPGAGHPPARLAAPGRGRGSSRRRWRSGGVGTCRRCTWSPSAIPPRRLPACTSCSTEPRPRASWSSCAGPTTCISSTTSRPSTRPCGRCRCRGRPPGFQARCRRSGSCAPGKLRSGEAAHLAVRGLTLCHLDATLRHHPSARRLLAADLEAHLAARGVEVISHKP